MDNQEEKIESLEQWQHVCGVIVVVGVVLEAVPRLPWHINQMGTAFVAIGIYGEILFGNKVSRIQKQLRLQLQTQIAAAKAGLY
jgi:hypothetical protein